MGLLSQRRSNATDTRGGRVGGIRLPYRARWAATMGKSVGTAVESPGSAAKQGGAGLHIRLVGAIEVSRAQQSLALPRSRKVRALLGYLALATGPISRSRLCDLLWDVPNDPRGELRWCLSKLRGVLDDESRCRVVTAGADRIALDLTDSFVDALEVDGALKAGPEQLTPARLGELRDAFR